MKMELIQPFINAADAVLAQSLRCRTAVGDVTMNEDTYRRRGIAAEIAFTGDIEGRIIFDLAPSTAAYLATSLSGVEIAAGDAMAGEAVLELANQVIGNAVTTLNNQGFNFRVLPPVVYDAEQGLPSTVDTEALLMSFETCGGTVFMNIAMRYTCRDREMTTAVGV